MTAWSGSPKESVVPPTCQHNEPADTPVSTTPDSQHSRRMTSRPWARHRASRLTVLPPDTQMTSWASRWLRMSVKVGMVNRARCVLIQPALPKALCTAAARASLSPTAVAMMQARGWEPARASSAARPKEGPSRRFWVSGPSAWKPMLVAMMVG